jgi:hypothetical protein
LDKRLLDRYGRALYNMTALLPADLSNLGIRFNQYIRVANDGNLRIWFLPAIQNDGTVVFGGELRFEYDKDGRRLLSKAFDYEHFYGAKPDKKWNLDIDRRANEIPSAGDIFFMLFFKNKFKRIMIWNRCYNTAFFDEDGKSAWAHFERQEEGCRGRK